LKIYSEEAAEEIVNEKKHFFPQAITKKSFFLSQKITE